MTVIGDHEQREASMEAVDHELEALRVRASQRQELAKLQARLPEVEGPCPVPRDVGFGPSKSSWP